MTAIQISRSWPEIEQAVELLISSRRSVNTQDAYRADWAKWFSFVRAEGTDLAVPGLAATTAFRDRLARTYSPGSIARILASLSFFYKALRDAGLVRANPFAKAWLPRPEVGDLHKTPAVEDDVVMQLERAIACDTSPAGSRDAAIVRILYDTGLRRASLAALRRDQLRRDGADLVVIVTVKGGKERFVKFTAESQKALAAWLAIAPPSPFVFPKRKRSNEHVSLATINKILKDRALAAGLPADAAHPHRFRAAFITAAYDARVYERDIQTAVHHANSATTRGYDRGQRGDQVFDQVSVFRKQRGQR